MPQTVPKITTTESLHERFERLYELEGVPVGGPLAVPPDFSRMTDGVTYRDEQIRSAFYWFKRAALPAQWWENKSTESEVRGKWLVAGGLLYRLTDGRRPENCDEINVTMANGSRDDEDRHKRAIELLALLEN